MTKLNSLSDQEAIAAARVEELREVFSKVLSKYLGRPVPGDWQRVYACLDDAVWEQIARDLVDAALVVKGVENVTVDSSGKILVEFADSLSYPTAVRLSYERS